MTHNFITSYTKQTDRQKEVDGQSKVRYALYRARADRIINEPV